MAIITDLAVAGLGAMGLGMALSLVRSGYNVTGYDINPDASKKLKAEGGGIVATVPELAQAAQCLICMVATSEQASNLFFEPQAGALWHLPKSSIIILGITARPDFVTAFQDKVDAAGREDIKVIDCPVSGGEARARAGTLSLICSGNDQSISRVQPILESLGTQIHTVPGGLGAASKVKFVHQILVGVNISAAIEVFALVQEAQLDLKSSYTNIMDSDAASWLFGQRISHVLDPASVPASSLSIIVKDLSMISAYGRTHGIHLLMALVAEQLFKLTYIANQDHSDDTKLLHLYRSESTSSSDRKTGTQSQIGFQDIIAILTGIHAAASIEVLTLAHKLGVSVPLLADVVENAAGSNKMFLKISKNLGTSENDIFSTMQELNGVTRSLTDAIDKMSAYSYPLPIASTAAQVLSFASKGQYT